MAEQKKAPLLKKEEDYVKALEGWVRSMNRTREQLPNAMTSA